MVFPMTYLIRVIGELDARWLDRFKEISITVTAAPGMTYVSTICTHDADQAMLVGILNALYNYQYPIFYLKCLDSPEYCES